jgi:centrosomal protein CEP19
MAVPLRLGVRFNPPTLVLHYSTEGGTQHRIRTMPIRDLGKGSDCYAEALKLKKRHEKFLGVLPTVRVEKFVRLLQETMRGKSVAEALEAIKMDFSINLEEDMNKLSDRDLQRRKELMDLNFERNRVKSGDPGFVYDKQVDFSQDLKVESGWDEVAAEEEEEDFWG